MDNAALLVKQLRKMKKEGLGFYYDNAGGDERFDPEASVSYGPLDFNGCSSFLSYFRML